MIKCKNCSKDINCERSTQKFCSSTCRGVNWARLNRNKHYMNPRNCNKCLELYTPNSRHPKYKYCNKCSGTIRYKGCREKGLERLKRYRNSKKGKLTRTFLQLKRQRKIKHLKEIFTVEEWAEKLINTFGVCPGCKLYVGIKKLTKDHIIPITKAPIGFSYSIEDVQPLCISCNSSKSNKN